MSRGGSSRDDLPEMTREIETAISLDPNFVDAYALLAFAMAQAGEPAKALAGMQKAVSLNPGNENYRFDLASMYMSNQKTDEAISIFTVLTRSSDPQVAQRGASALAQAQEFKSQLAASRELRPREAAVVPSAAPPDASAAVTFVADSSPVKFVKGTIVSVDCSSAPSATLYVLSGTKTWQMRVADSKRVLVLGADNFSCDWKKQKVAVNYRDTGDGTGTIVSIEVQ
jgi:hypothetical protein